METSIISENIIRYRHDRRLSRVKLAIKAGLSQGSLANLEKGKTAPRLDTLQKVAKGLDISVKELLTPVKKLTEVRFRAQKKLKRRDQILARASRWLEDFNELQTLLGVDRTSSLQIPKRIQALSVEDRPIEAAQHVRRAMGLEDDEPIHDLAGLLASRGIKVLPHSVASDSFFGMSIGKTAGGPAIVVNTHERIPVERWIFSAAHELAHLVLHADAYDVSVDEEVDAEEKEANIFAGYFLMPQRGFLKEWEESYGMHWWDRILKVKRIYRVSYKAVLYRLVDLGVYDETAWKKVNLFLRQHPNLNASGAREPASMKPSDFCEDWLSWLVRGAVEKQLVTLSRASEILEKPLDEMKARAAIWAGEKTGLG